MKKILILTASFGDGYNAAARNVREAIELTAADVKVEVLDLFESTYGTLNQLLRQAYHKMVRYAPTVWSGVFSVFDSPSLFRGQLGSMVKLRESLARVLHDTEPDVVVSTYPMYGHLIKEIYREHAERPFRFLTLVTNSLNACAEWYRAPSDLFIVCNEPTARALIESGVQSSRVRTIGFPVNLAFAQERSSPSESELTNRHRKVLYVINTGKAKAGKSLRRLLRIPGIELTITVGHDPSLKAKLTERLREHGKRVRVYGWTNQMPQLLMSHDLVIGKAGAALVQEAIAAGCPMIINQVIPGREEGNARLVEQLGVGAVADTGKKACELVEEAFAHKGRKWQQWRDRLEKLRRPDAALRIAELIVQEAQQSHALPDPLPLFPPVSRDATPRAATRKHGPSSLQLCDFHIHTNYSDGRLTLPEVIDFYGWRGFDCICITDHVADPRRLIGKFSELLNFTVACDQLEEYFDVLERERRRAWRKYGMLVMTGLEFNKEGLTRKTSGHLLGLDLKAPISPALDFPEIIAQIHSQGGLAVAAHPHVMKSEWGKNTLFLWENQEIFAPIIDAWEIANRNNIFTPIGLKRLAFLANSDFHKPKHIYSWKTLLHCEKDPEAIKECIRLNKHVAITLYRDGMSGQSLRSQFQLTETLAPEEFPLELSAPAISVQ